MVPVCPSGFYFLLNTFLRGQFLSDHHPPCRISLLTASARRAAVNAAARTGVSAPDAQPSRYAGEPRPPGAEELIRSFSRTGTLAGELQDHTPREWTRAELGPGAWPVRGGAWPAWEDGSPQLRGDGRIRILDFHVLRSGASGDGGRENPASGSLCFL